MKIRKNTVATSKGEATLYTLTNAAGATVVLSSIGAGIVAIEVPDRDGALADVVLGYDKIEDYLYDGPCAGKTPGRYANRIAGGRLKVAGREYQLAVNCGPNHLHGGPEGFQNKIWDAEEHDGKVIFSRVSPDGEERYPGNLDVKVIYEWSDDNTLSIRYEARTDAETVVNLTNHTYFHLGGHDRGDALDHELQLFCSRFLKTDDSLAPTGRLLPVAGTPMDFIAVKKLRRDIRADFTPLRYGKGYDHCWAVDGWSEGQLCRVAILRDPSSGRVLEVLSDQPSAQVYTGNWLTGSPKGKCGYEYRDYDCVAIECQGMPDAPNRPGFPSQTLCPGEKYIRRIVYRFSND